MQKRSYSLNKVKTEAKNLLKIKNKRNKITFLNYRTIFKYFIYYFEKINLISEKQKKI